MVEEKEGNNGFDEGYGQFLQDLIAQGVIADGDKIAKEGLPLLDFTQQRPSNAALLASVPSAEKYYEKKEKNKALLLDLMNRTNFRSRNEVIYFLDWVDWCEEFTGDFEGPIRYCVAINSEGGKAREQYTDAITTWRFRHYGTNKYTDKPRTKHTESPLS